jgi:hypothetical protein
MIRYAKGYIPAISEITCTTRTCSNKTTYDWTWTAPDLDLASLDAYMAQSTSLKENWNEDEIAPDWDQETDANFSDTFYKIYISL